MNRLNRRSHAAGHARPPWPTTRIAKLVTGAAIVSLVTVACTASPQPDSSGAAGTNPVLARETVQADPVIAEVTSAQWRRMKAAGMVRPECPIQDRAELRSVSINFTDFEGQVHRGQLIVNRDVAASVTRIFTRLFEAGFPIRRMKPVEEYGGDANRSLRADNTSAFNCRRVGQINAPFMASPHANGRAVDINPRENPWMDLRCDCWFPSPDMRARTPGPGKILRGGLVWRLFRNEGWIWQNIGVPDFMHFDTGYPSRPFRRGKRTTSPDTASPAARMPPSRRSNANQER